MGERKCNIDIANLWNLLLECTCNTTRYIPGDGVKFVVLAAMHVTLKDLIYDSSYIQCMLARIQYVDLLIVRVRCIFLHMVFVLALQRGTIGDKTLSGDSGDNGTGVQFESILGGPSRWCPAHHRTGFGAQGFLFVTATGFQPKPESVHGFQSKQRTDKTRFQERL